MRYDDASGAFQASGPVANDDADTLSAGERGPATGNLITGEGTQYGSAGADSAAGAQITAIAGKAGEDSSFSGGKLSVEGEHGRLSVDADGNYSYMANGDVENVRDRFTYTLADSAGNSDTAALIIEIGKTPAVIKANAQQIVPGPDGVVTLPAGVELSDIHVVGRNLVIDMPDGTQLIIIDGAIFVPQLVLGGVEVPATNVAALLIGQEIQPAAGELPPSSGGNFALPPPPLDPGIPLGDLIPPTEYNYIPPQPEEVFDILDEEPEAGAATAQLDDDAQDDGNPGGVGDDPGTDIAEGTLPGSGGDGQLTWDLLPEGTLPNGTFSFQDQLNGDVWILQNGNHVLTVSVDPLTGDYTVTQVAAIDHPAGNDENNLEFVINYNVIDEDGDVALGTLTVNVDDDTPVAIDDPQRVTGLVDEDDLPAGNDDVADGDDDPGNADGDNDGTTTAGAAGSLSGLFSFGADQPGTLGLGTDTSGMTAQGLTSNGVALTYAVVGDTLTASAGGSTVFTLTVNADGSWSFDLEGQLDHEIADTEDNLDIDFSSMIVGTDHDGDTASLPDDTFVITVDDDLPVPAGEREQVTGLVDEDDLPAGNHDVQDGDDDPGNADGDNDGTTTGGDAGSLSSLFSFGADQPGTVELSSDTSGLPALTSNNVAVTYSVNGNVLTASAGGSTVFTLTVNPDGSWVFDLEGQLDHSIAGTEDNLFLDFSSIIIGVDADGDTASLPAESFVVNVDDDMPQEFEECPDDVITVNDPDVVPFTGNLNLPPVGADEPGVVTFGVSDGDPVLDNADNPITSGGVELFYFINEDGVLEARAGDENGEVIFTITLNGDGTFTFDQLGVIGEGGEFTFNDLTSTSAGNVEFRGVGADDPTTTVDLLLSAEDGGADATVNTDSDSIGAANQSMDDGETVRIDFVSNLTTGAATPSQFGYGDHVSSSSFIGLIPQVQGNQDETVAFTVWALDSSNTQATEPDRDPAGGFSDSTITQITDVTVKDYLTGQTTGPVDVTGFAVGVFTPIAYGISVRVNADGSVTFSGIQQGDSYGFSTGAGEFNAVAVQADPAGTGGSTEDSFDLGVFSIGITNEFEPVDLTVPIVLTDADGDPVVCDIDIHIGAPLDADDITVTVNEAGLPLIGSDPGSNSETQGGDLQGQVSGGTGPYTFALAPGESADGTYGTLTLNPDGTFSYTLDTPFDSQPDADDGTNPELGAESFQVVATDSLGATQTLTINVNIIDDVPTAVDDTDDIDAGEYGPVDGNVITDASAGDAGDSDDGADTQGADGATVVGVVAGHTNADLDNPATVGVVIQGDYGKLTLNSDGSYSYTRDPGTDGGVEDVFTYTIEDGDGDLSNATLTITIDDSPPTIDAPDEGEAGTIVDEKGLPTRGESPGTGEFADGNGNDNDDTSETTSGVINFTAPDGPAIVRIDGVVVTGVAGQTFNGSHGVLTITSYDAGTGQIGYSYTLSDNTSGDATFDDFALEVEDQDGDIANDTLTIDIIDDEPLASNDVDSVVGGFDPATGNVLTGVEVAVGEDTNGTDGVADNPGADGGRVTDIDHDASPAEAVPNGGSTDIQGDYGVLTIYSNGDYSYQRDPGTPGGVEDVFTYTLTDGDGDTTTATLTIGIDDNFPVLPDPDLIRLDDDVIPGANGNLNGPGDDDPDAVPGNVVNGQLNGTGGDAPLTYNFTGLNTLPTGFSIGAASDVNTLLIVQDQGGSDVTVMTIELDQSDGSFTVTQDAPILHDPTNPGAGAGQEDNFEDNLLFSIGVEVEDNDGDVEPATITINVDDDTPTINVTQNNESGVVLTTQDAETDGNPTAEDTAVSAINFGGVFGLTQSAGADGAAAPATLAFDLNVVAQNSGLTSQGSVINLFEVGGVIYGTTAGVAPVDGTTPGVVFSLQVSNTGVVTLTQYQQVDHAVEGVTTSPFDDQFATLVNGKITLTASSSLTDNDGDTVTDQEVVDLGGNIRFADDGPDAVNDSADQLTENSSVTVNVFANDAPGADGVNVVGGIAVVPGSLTGAGGLVYNNDGTFTYTPAAGEEGSITFQYQLTDFDGDTDIATVTINLLPDSLPVAADGVAKVDDDGLPAGIGDNASGDLDANSGEAAVVNPSEAIWHGQLVAAGGGDTIVDYDFSSMHGTSGSVGTETVDYTWDNGSSTLTATISGGARDGLELFNVVVNQSTGSYNLTLVRNVQHADEVANQENDATTNLTFTVTDSDGSTDTGLVTVTFDDDMPVVTDVTDPLEIPNTGATPSGTGNFAFDIGADQNADFDDISVSNFTILINGEAATNVVLTPDVDGNGDPAPETATTASYRFTFQYDTGEGGLTNGVGTLVFNKATGEYTVTLTSGPIEGFTILQTGSETTTFVEYDLNGGAPDVVTAQLADSLFAQFTAVSTNNNGTPNLLTTGGNNIAWNPGELFTADPGNPQVSSTDAGVDGNTMDTGEVLDFDLFTSDPGSNTALTPDGSATEMFIQFFQFTADDDIIVILKLQDADNPAITTTRAILIDGDDVFLDGDTATGTSYEGLVAGLGSQDALVVIQSNDYNAVGENWVIVGAQIVTDNDGTTGTGIDLDGDLGPGGASDRDGDGDFGTDSGNAALDELDTFADDTDVSGLKITSIGFLVPSTEAQSATIEFDVTIEDSDGDQVVTQDITVQIGDPPALTLAAESSFSTQSLSKMAANDDYSSSLYAASDGQKYGGNGFGNIGNTGITSAMVAASGFAAMSMTSLNSFSQPSFDTMVQDGLQQLSAQVTGREMMGGEDFGSLSLAGQLDGSAVNAVNLSNSGISFEDHGFVGSGLDAMSFGDAGPAYVPNYAAGQPVMASIPAFAANVPTVSMASAEMLKAASLEGHVQQGGGVEQVLADALGNDAPTIDGVLANLPGGIAGLSAIANLASPDGAGVPAWDMGMHGGFAPAHDMLMKVAAVEIHQDAVQPA